MHDAEDDAWSDDGASSDCSELSGLSGDSGQANNNEGDTDRGGPSTSSAEPFKIITKEDVAKLQARLLVHPHAPSSKSFEHIPNLGQL